MCFGDKNNYNDPPPKPAQIPQHSPSSSKLPARASMPPSYGGSPPSKNNPFSNNNRNYADIPPPGPPPAPANDAPGQQHDWESAVPDTALLPPPPNFFGGFERSPANNATEGEAEAGEAWCREHPLYAPQRALDPAALAALSRGNINMLAPPRFRGTLSRLGPGLWRGATTAPDTPDTYIATYPPLYSPAAHSPLATGRAHTAYFEVRLLRNGGDDNDEVTLALGFGAPPYPGFRLPGWHRGSLAVHGDDGNKYVNMIDGGEALTAPFRPGETVGLGMRLAPPGGNGGNSGGNGNGNNGIGVEVFLTRDGRVDARWDLHEERDTESATPVTGLEGFHDLCAAVGVFGRTAFEVVFVPERWAWKGAV
ncbi:SPRY domain-containing protein [Biscogniauxia mediterranea]|nr:SPRY domain-containing protein [Biscogniauxia mediterranea]